MVYTVIGIEGYRYKNMSNLFFDCSMGAAGDMVTASLLDLFPDREKMVEELNALGIPGVRYQVETVSRGGVTGLHMKVTVQGMTEEEAGYLCQGKEAHHHAEETGSQVQEDNYQEKETHCQGPKAHHHEDSDHHGEDAHHGHGAHVHVSYQKVQEIVSKLTLPQKVKEDVFQIYRIIAEAEAAAHGIPMKDIHFHEVGTMDAIADVTAAAYLMERLHPDAVFATPIRVGAGTVLCAHGELPVPAPATKRILEGIPYYKGDIQTELCTPTGAALLKYFVQEFRTGNVPDSGIKGRGFGSKALPLTDGINCLTVSLFEEEGQLDIAGENAE